jgi:hypothetical protein
MTRPDPLGGVRPDPKYPGGMDCPCGDWSPNGRPALSRRRAIHDPEGFQVLEHPKPFRIMKAAHHDGVRGVVQGHREPQ